MSIEARTLQINESGSWRDICTFALDQLQEVSIAASALARILGNRPTWRIVNKQYPYGDKRRVVLDDAQLRACRIDCKVLP